MRLQLSTRGRWRWLLAVALVLSLVAAACGDDDDTTASDDGGTTGGAEDDGGTTGGAEDDGGTTGGAEGEPVSGGELTYLVPIESPSMDPCDWNYSGQGTNGLRAVAVYDSLVRLNNETLEYEYHIAESFEPSEDFSTWTLKIRDGVTFTDGTPYDAEAVKFNWERLGDEALGCRMANYVANIASMTVTDPLTLEIELTEPSATFIGAVSSRIGVIASPTALQSLGPDFGSQPVGAGPFIVESWIKDDEMVLTRNPDYYLADEGLPYLDGVTIRPLLVEDQRRASLEQGEADLIFTQVGTTIAALEDAGFPVTKFYLQGAENLLFNLTKPPFDDVRVRRALVQSVDPQQLIDVVLNGTVEPADGFIYPPSPFDDPSVQWPAPDCGAAGEAWAELAEENGGPIEMTIGAFNQGQPPSVEFMQAAISQCGGDNVDVSLDIVEAAVASENVFSGNYEAHGWGIQFVGRPESILVQLTCDSPRNTTGFCNEEFDALLAEANVTSDLGTLADLYSQIESIMAEELPVFFYKRSVVSAPHAENVHGVTMYEDGIIPLEGIWIEE